MNPYRSALPLVLSGVLLAMPAWAGRAQTGDSKETVTTTTSGSKIQVSFNPTATVILQPGETLEGALERLAAEINTAGNGDYVATVEEASPALDIRRSDGTEIDQLRLLEDDPQIQRTEIAVLLPDLIARIGRVKGEPAGGMIFITLNDRVIPIPSTAQINAPQLDEALSLAVAAAGFEAVLLPDGLVVTRDLIQNRSITTVGWQSTDPGLVESDVALELSGAIPTLAPWGLTALGVLLALAGLSVLRRPHRSNPS